MQLYNVGQMFPYQKRGLRQAVKIEESQTTVSVQGEAAEAELMNRLLVKSHRIEDQPWLSTWMAVAGKGCAWEGMVGQNDAWMGKSPLWKESAAPKAASLRLWEQISQGGGLAHWDRALTAVNPPMYYGHCWPKTWNRNEFLAMHLAA